MEFYQRPKEYFWNYHPYIKCWELSKEKSIQIMGVRKLIIVAIIKTEYLNTDIVI